MFKYFKMMDRDEKRSFFGCMINTSIKLWGVSALCSLPIVYLAYKDMGSIKLAQESDWLWAQTVLWILVPFLLLKRFLFKPYKGYGLELLQEKMPITLIVAWCLIQLGVYSALYLLNKDAIMGGILGSLAATWFVAYRLMDTDRAVLVKD